MTDATMCGCKMAWVILEKRIDDIRKMTVQQQIKLHEHQRHIYKLQKRIRKIMKCRNRKGKLSGMKAGKNNNLGNRSRGGFQHERLGIVQSHHSEWMSSFNMWVLQWKRKHENALKGQNGRDILKQAALEWSQLSLEEKHKWRQEKAAEQASATAKRN